MLGLSPSADLDNPPSDNPGIGGALISVEKQGCPGPYSITSSSIIHQWPLKNIKINQFFHGGHSGVDLDGELYDPIYAVSFGFVEKAEYMRGGYGWHVVIKHSNGFSTLYGHMVEEPVVKPGDYVFPGKTIGFVGSTGHSTGPHLHFEVLKDQCYLDPKTIIDGGY